MGLRQTVKPTTEPVTYQEACEHLRVDSDDEQGLITRIIATGRRLCERITNQQFLTATWQYTGDSFYSLAANLASDGGFARQFYSQAIPVVPYPGSYIELPKPPLQAVSSIQYVEPGGATLTLSPTDYIVVTDRPVGAVFLQLGKVWPPTRAIVNAVTITFTCGYGAAVDVPAEVKSAVLLACEDLFHFRGNMLTGTISKEVELSIKRLLWDDRVSIVS